MNTSPEQPELLTASQVARMLQVNAKTVTRWAREGRLKFLRTPGGHRRYDRSDHWFVFRGSLNGGEFRCGCGLSFLNAHQLGVHVKTARADAIPFGSESEPQS